MSEKQWEQFFALVDLIMALPGTWQEKKSTVQAKAEKHGSETNWEELTAWFAESE